MPVSSSRILTFLNDTNPHLSDSRTARIDVKSLVAEFLHPVRLGKKTIPPRSWSPPRPKGQNHPNLSIWSEMHPSPELRRYPLRPAILRPSLKEIRVARIRLRDRQSWHPYDPARNRQWILASGEKAPFPSQARKSVSGLLTALLLYLLHVFPELFQRIPVTEAAVFGEIAERFRNLCEGQTAPGFHHDDFPQLIAEF